MEKNRISIFIYKLPAFVTISFFMIGLALPITAQGAQEKPQSLPGEKKFQIQIEEEIEEGVKTEQTESEGEEIIVSGEDEQLIRTFKSDTTFIPPGDASSIRWLDDKTQIDKDGKKNRRKINEKSGDIIAAYGMYDNYFLNVKFAKTDKFGLYQLRYARDNAVSEGIDGTEIPDSFHSGDDVRISIGSRILPIYTLLFDATYRGDNAGFQENILFSEYFRRLGNFKFQNQFKLDNRQILNIDLAGNYLQTDYFSPGLSITESLYLTAASNAQWIYIFENKITLEALGHYDYIYLKDLDMNEGLASTAELQALIHFPIVSTSLGPSRGTAWQLNLIIGGGGFYRDVAELLPTAKLILDNKYDFWTSQLHVERTMHTVSLEETHMNSLYEKPLFYASPEIFWHYFWENGFSFNENNDLKFRLGFKQYEVYYNPVLDSGDFYYREPILYDEIYGRIGWEYTFFNNFMLQLGLDLNYGLMEINMRPLYTFLIGLNYNTERFEASISLKGIGKRNLDSIIINDYYLLGASLRFWINPSFALMASGENLFNQVYTEYYPYQNSGIKIFAGCYIKI